MKKYVILALLGLILSACGQATLPSGEYILMPADGQQITPGVWKYENADGAWVIVLQMAISTENAPSATPTATPSATPSATVTPTPTATSTPTVTPSSTPGQGEPPTPTPETVEPPPTFTVTPVPSKVCVIKTGAFGINERSDHSTSAPRLGSIPAGSVVTIEEFWQGTPYLWARSAIGWFVVREDSTWWVYGLEGTDLCDAVPGWPAGLAPPPAIVANPLTGDTLAGLHFAWYSDHARAAQTAPLVGLAKCLTLTGSMCDTMRAANPRLVTIYRDYRSECPTRDQVYTDAAGYYARLRALWQDAPGYDYYELQNECSGLSGQEDYAALAQFSIEVATRAAADGYCVLALSSYPGSPEISEFVQLEPYLRFADATPCGTWPNGAPKYHGIATHATGYCPASVDTSAYPWVGWVWVAGRHLLYAEALAQTRGYDMAAKRFVWIQTEWGLTYGQDEDGGAFTAGDLQACVRETVRVLSDQDIIDGFTVWNYGKVGSWLDYTGYLPGMFQ
jgi:hypothetical protein